MRKFTSILVAAMALIVPMTGAAKETGSVALGFRAGTLGAGLEVNYPISSKLTVSAGINNYKGSETDTADDIDYDIDVKLQTVSLLAHYHVFSGSFRLTAGAMLNNNELNMTAKSAATYDINGVVYNASDVGKLTADVTFNKFAPYLGLGWGYSASTGIGFSFDVGLLMHGEPKVDLDSKGGVLSNDPTLQANLAAAESDAEDDLSEFKAIPVVSVGVNARF